MAPNSSSSDFGFKFSEKIFHVLTSLFQKKSYNNNHCDREQWKITSPLLFLFISFHSHFHILWTLFSDFFLHRRFLFCHVLILWRSWIFYVQYCRRVNPLYCVWLSCSTNKIKLHLSKSKSWRLNSLSKGKLFAYCSKTANFIFVC